MTVAQRTSPAAAAAAVQAVVELFPGRDSAVISRGVAVAETNAAPVTLKAIVTDVLTWLGMRALVPDVPVPDLPVPSVIESFWLAVRDLQRKYNNQRPATRLTLFDQDPDGAIRGRLNATDFESDPISYTVTATPARGAVAVDADGDFVYTPGAQIAAGGGADSFTVTLDDGARHGLFGLARQTTVKVAITVIPVGTQADPTQVSVVANVSLDGIQSGAPTFNADGTRALVTTYELNSGYTRQNWRVAMIDTIAGTQVGTPTALPGPWLSSMMSADGTRAVITAFDQDATGYTTWVETIDTATGTQIGAAFSLPGQASGTLLTPSGSRALFTTATYDSATGMNSTAAAVIDTATGAQVGPTITLPGLSSTIVSADGTRAVVAAVDQGAAGFTTRVAAIDTATGAQIGTTATFAGYASLQLLSPGGNSALLTTHTYDPVTGPDETQVSVIDTASGAAIGPDFTFAGYADQTPVSADGHRVLMTSATGDTTKIAVIDTATGVQVGSTLTFGAPAWGPRVNSDGSTALITTSVNNGANSLVAILDTATGTQTGATLTLSGDVRIVPPALLSSDGSRAVVLTGVFDYSLFPNSVGFATRVFVVDNGRSTQLGTAVTVPGEALVGMGSILLAADGTRAIITTEDFNGRDTRGQEIYSTQVAVIDTTTGAQIGTTLALTGRLVGADVLSVGGTHALIATDAALAVIDTITGSQTDTLTIAGTRPVFSADHSRALVATVDYNRFTRTYSTQVAVLKVV